LRKSNKSKRYHIPEYVRWSDVDAAGFIRWNAYVRFMELAETEFYRAIGFTYKRVFSDLNIWLIRAQSHMTYRRPVMLDDLLDIQVTVGHLGRSSIRLDFTIHAPTGDTAAEAHHIIVSTTREQPPKPVPVPQLLRDALAPYRMSPKPTPNDPAATDKRRVPKTPSRRR
jgi:acyl-CoA thioester hydrolase